MFVPKIEGEREWRMRKRGVYRGITLFRKKNKIGSSFYGL